MPDRPAAAASPSRPPLHWRQSGFSLTEYMVGITLAGMLLAGAIGTLGIGLKAFSSARDLERATQILQHETEAIRLLSWSELTALEKEETYPPAPAFQKAYRDKFRLRRQLIEDHPDQLRMEVSVFWTDFQGRERDRSITLLLSKNGLGSSYRRFL